MYYKGLKLHSTNIDNYYQEAKKLYDQKIFDYIELFTIPNSIETIKIWKQLNIPYIIHAPYFSYGFNLADKENYQQNLKIYHEVKEFADELNAKYIIFHGGVEGSYKETIRQLNSFNENRVLIENKPLVAYEYLGRDYKCIGYSPEEIKKIKNETGCGFVLDFGHAICSANSQKKDIYNYCHQFNQLKPDMYHLSDSKDTTSPYDDHSHLGKGQMDLKIINNLIFNNSMVTIETPKDYPNNLEDFKEDINVLKNI